MKAIVARGSPKENNTRNSLNQTGLLDQQHHAVIDLRAEELSKSSNQPESLPKGFLPLHLKKERKDGTSNKMYFL